MSTLEEIDAALKVIDGKRLVLDQQAFALIQQRTVLRKAQERARRCLKLVPKDKEDKQ